MSKELVEKARALDLNTTPGPWELRHQVGVVWSSAGHRIAEAWAGNYQEDAKFIAESRTLLPALADLAESEGKRADEAERERDDLLRRPAESRALRAEQDLARIKGAAGGGGTHPLTTRARTFLADALRAWPLADRDIETIQELDALLGSISANAAPQKSIKEIQERHTAEHAIASSSNRPKDYEWTEAHNDRAILLDAVCALTADRDAALSELARLKGQQP